MKQVAPTEVTVLLLGETGTGKGVIARAIHNASTHKDRPLIQVNCGALAPTLIESELFGHEKGAFTGAQTRKIGRFEIARGTTLFLDEIGELSLGLQVRLLRVLHDGEFERVGGTTTVRSEVRIIAATNKDLEKEVEAGRFRRDLWYRLNIFPIHVPPLRERMDDLPALVNFFVEKYAKKMGKHFDVIPQKDMKALQAHFWPGNVQGGREHDRTGADHEPRRASPIRAAEGGLGPAAAEPEPSRYGSAVYYQCARRSVMADRRHWWCRAASPYQCEHLKVQNEEAWH